MSQANQIKDIYIENLDKILERGEKLELLQKKTEKLLQYTGEKGLKRL